MFNRILVPLDGSALAERALEPAVILCERDDAEMLLLRASVPEKILVPDANVAGGYGLLWPDQSLAQARTEAQNYLKSIRRAKAPVELKVRLEVVEGGVAESIVDVSAAKQCDLIVMSSHGYSGVTRWVMGSIAEKVLHSAPCPVLMLRAADPVRHVLIPLDGSDLSEHALAAAFAVAAGLGARVTLLRAAHLVEAAEVARLDEVERGLGRRLQEEIFAEAQAYLRQVIAARRPAGVEVAAEVTFEPAAEAILRYAEAHAVDVIAMSTHGRTGLRRWVYGSVTEKMLRGWRHSMLVVRPAAHQLN